MACLRVEDLTKLFGGLTAVAGVSFSVAEESITGLIGPNGSGKTVTFDCITGFYRPDGGRVFFQERDITARPPHEVARAGIARSFQITGVFPKLTVWQNLIFATQEKRVLRNVRTSLGAGDGREPRALERIERVVRFIGLSEVRDEVVANLPYAQQKILEFAGLMLMNPDPALYLLDEPFAGLTQGEIGRYVSLMREMRQGGKTFLIVEHNMRVMMTICDRIVVLDHGEKIAEGAPAEVSSHPRVVEAYLGHAAPAQGH